MADYNNSPWLQFKIWAFLRLVSYIFNVTSISGLSILICTFGFLWHLYNEYKLGVHRDKAISVIICKGKFWLPLRYSLTFAYICYSTSGNIVKFYKNMFNLYNRILILHNKLCCRVYGVCNWSFYTYNKVACFDCNPRFYSYIA
jgi:hypothetical protein